MLPLIKKGRTASIIKKIIYYKDAPRLIIDQCPETSSVNAITISGKVTDKNDKYPKVYINGELQNVNLYGAWSKKVNLIEGRNTFEIKATNSAGKCVVVIKTIVFNMDVPILVLTNCPETSTLNKVNISGRVSDINDKSPKVYINDELVSVNSYYGTWTKDVALKEGVNIFTIKATNSLGKMVTITKTIKFNSVAPELIISNCPDTSILNKVNISGRVSDVNDKSPKVYINDELISVNSYYGTWSKDVALKEGDNAFTIKAINSLGKVTTIIKTIKFNCAAPELIISNCPATSTLNKVNLSGRVSDINDKSPKVYINDELVSVDSYYGTWSKEVTLKEGGEYFCHKSYQ